MRWVWVIFNWFAAILNLYSSLFWAQTWFTHKFALAVSIFTFGIGLAWLLNIVDKIAKKQAQKEVEKEILREFEAIFFTSPERN